MQKIFYYSKLTKDFYEAKDGTVPYAKMLLERGNGAFETTLYFPDSKVLLYREKHVRRLMASCGYIGIPLAEFFSCDARNLRETLEKLYQQAAESGGAKFSSHLRLEAKIIVSADMACVIVRELAFTKEQINNGVELISVTHEKPLPLIKCPGFYAPTEMLIQKANEVFGGRHIEECLMLDAKGRFLEGSKAAFFAIDVRGRILTAKPGRVLASITAEAVKNIALKKRWKYREGDFDLYALWRQKKIKEMFIASSLRGIVGVNMVIPVEHAITATKGFTLKEIHTGHVQRIDMKKSAYVADSGNEPTVEKIQDLYAKEIQRYIKQFKII